LKNTIWSRDHSLFWKVTENSENKCWSAKIIFWIYESVICRESIIILKGLS